MIQRKAIGRMLRDSKRYHCKGKSEGKKGHEGSESGMEKYPSLW